MRLSVFQRKSILLYQRLTELKLYDYGDLSKFRFVDTKNRANNSEPVATRTIESWRTKNINHNSEKTKKAKQIIREILTKRFSVEAYEAFASDRISVDVFCRVIEFHRIRAHALIDAFSPAV